jgi:uncharacterized membrane protein
MVLAGALIWLAGAVWYFYDLRRGIYRLHPVWTYALMAVGLGVVVAGIVGSPGIWEWAALGVMVILTGLFLYWMLIYSVTPDTFRLQVGEPMPEFEVKDSEGSLFRSRELVGQKPALYVFYRGAW